MAKIRIPKSFLELIKSKDPEIITELIGTFKATDNEGRYLHWDKLKWRVPKDIDPEIAWLITKIARRSNSKVLNLLQADKDTTFFNFNIPDSLFSKLHHIDRITGGGHKLGDSMFLTNVDKDRFLLKNLIMEEAITSSQLEGASTTRKVAKEMLKSERTPKDDSEKMIFNNFMLMKKAVEIKDKPLSIDSILELHEIATHEAIENDAVAGAFRNDNEITVKDAYQEIAHLPPCHSTINDRMELLCKFANNKDDDFNSELFIHPIVKAIILHFMIGYIHPFGDGNGRTARALFYWYMLKSGYWLFEYVSISKLIKENRSEYDKSYLYTETDDFDLTYFIYNQVDIIINAVDSLLKHIDKKKKEFYDFMEWIEKSPVSKRLNYGHLKILKEAVKQPGKVFTSKIVSGEFDITENTARNYLNKLVDENLLLKAKSKNSKLVNYVAPAGLQDLLKIQNSRNDTNITKSWK